MSRFEGESMNLYNGEKGVIINGDCLTYLQVLDAAGAKVTLVSCPPWGHGKKVVASPTKKVSQHAREKGHGHAGTERKYKEPKWNNKLDPAYYEALKRFPYILFGANYYFEELTGGQSFPTPWSKDEIKHYHKTHEGPTPLCISDFVKRNPRNWLIWDKEKPTGLSFSRFELAYTNLDVETTGFSYMWNGLCTKQADHRYRLDRLHETEKPWGFMADIIKKFTPDGSTIVDPFGGSMSVPLAVRGLLGTRRFVGIEKDPVMARKAAERFEDVNRQRRLF
ncbi:MAG: site-specific DNA-methyltransferase [bacterium]|nr:site-specific DNA-methyltransferase [bacterium]